ncbi:hypothetical protein ACLOJK_024571 [Asimina triloba]
MGIDVLGIPEPEKLFTEPRIGVNYFQHPPGMRQKHDYIMLATINNLIQACMAFWSLQGVKGILIQAYRAYKAYRSIVEFPLTAERKWESQPSDRTSNQTGKGTRSNRLVWYSSDNHGAYLFLLTNGIFSVVSLQSASVRLGFYKLDSPGIVSSMVPYMRTWVFNALMMYHYRNRLQLRYLPVLIRMVINRPATTHQETRGGFSAMTA